MLAGADREEAAGGLAELALRVQRHRDREHLAALRRDALLPEPRLCTTETLRLE